MHCSARSRVAAAALVTAIAACDRSPGRLAETSARSGLFGISFLVEVQRPTNGTVSTADRRIDCGSAPSATACAATFAWSEQAVLVATADPGSMFGGWAGDCSGRDTDAAGHYVCVLDTSRYGADKYVVAVFGPVGQTQHPNFTEPTVHGPAFLSWLAGEPDAFECTACHGAGYGGLGIAPSCNACHAAAGWASWQTSCSFCHGARTAAAKAGYALLDHPAWAAPPEAVSERLTGIPAPERTGAHAIHLGGSALAGPVRCGACHEVPATFSHVSGRDARATVVLTAPGQPAPDPAGYDRASGTCATACHGAGRSPPWTSAGLACDGCHAIPPPTPAHTTVSGADLAACAACHPDTITAAGGVDVAGGHHVNGTVDRVGGHASGFALPASHGSQYLDFVAGAPGASRCTSCHGAALALCASCHSRPESGGWTSWRTSCTFCHGTRTPSGPAPTLALSSPPGGVSQRLTGTAVPERTGKHRSHLNGKPGYPAFACATCHAVPATDAHVRADRRAPVAFDAAAAFPALTAEERAALPSPLAVYDPGASPPRCTNAYCHGATLAGGRPGALQSPPRWSSAAPGINDCAVCHGDPPETGRLVAADEVYCLADCSLHAWHVQALPASCDACHHGSAPANAAALHVNGRADVAWGAGVTGTWDPQARTCAVSCHAGAGPRAWR